MTSAARDGSAPDLRASTALVLGGGGSTGNAWLIGVIAGLREGGLDVASADLIVGTSAGSTAAAQVTGAPVAELFEATVAAVSPAPGSTASPGTESTRSAPTPAVSTQPVEPSRVNAASAQMEHTAALIAASADAEAMRRAIGAAALESYASSDEAMQARWRATVASRLPSQHWPEQRVLITAVDAQNGQQVAFDRTSGIELADAVAASCSNGFAYRIGSSFYIDGGYRTNADNADLAAGYARVLVLSPLGSKARTPKDWGLHLETQLGELRAHGSQVEVVIPDSNTEHLFGANAMNLALRPDAARAGFAQGHALAQQLAGFWRTK